jgi:threonylcarbamoyladenosine tRNA methylthiotransferase MtaB
MTRRFFVETFGCRTNQADSAAIREDLSGQGWVETNDFQEAEIVVVNSCTVTHRTDQQVRQLSRRFRRLNPRAHLVLTGCYAQRAPQEAADLGAFDAIVGNTHKHQLTQIIDGLTLGDVAAVYHDDFSRDRTFDCNPVSTTNGRTRPFVKIQDGCNAACSYCIVPAVRGPSRSVPPDQILTHVQRLIEVGYREVVLTGIHIGSYGLHFQPRFPLHRLIRKIAALPALGQLRMSSLEPMELSRRIITFAAENPVIAPHFHVCLQSGSDRILKQMRRPYTAERFAQLVQEIRKLIPHAGIGSDVIVGFPGETEADHRETVRFVEAMPFTYLHVFPYSDRQGTAASTMPAKVRPDTIKARAAELRLLSAEKNQAFRRQFIGRRLKVLTLSEEISGRRRGLSSNYLPVTVPLDVPDNRLLEGTVTAEKDGNLMVD